MTVRWVITTKDTPIEPTVKARLVAHGFQEAQSFQTDSPTCSKESICLTLAIITSMSWHLMSLDIKTAFLHCQSVNRTVHIKPPPEANTNMLWQLNKCIYGLADAPQVISEKSLSNEEFNCRTIFKCVNIQLKISKLCILLVDVLKQVPFSITEFTQKLLYLQKK